MLSPVEPTRQGNEIRPLVSPRQSSGQDFAEERNSDFVHARDASERRRLSDLPFPSFREIAPVETSA